MVSSSGPDSDWSFFAAIGRLGPTVAFMAFVGALSLGSIEISRIAFERSVAQHATNECSKQRDKAGCQSATAEIRSALAAEHAVQLGVWQTAFNFFGLIGLFFTVIYAKRAWEAASSSAKADNEALELTREALKEQREGAAEQAQMATRQIAASERLAIAARRQAEIARDTASKHLRAYVYAVKMVFHWDTDEGYPIFSVFLKNTGLTPATYVKMGGVAIMSGRLNRPHFPQIPNVVSEITIGAGTTEEVVIYVHDAQMIRQGLIDDENVLFVFGVVQYRDIHGSNYESRFGFCTYGPVLAERGMARLIGIDHVFVEIVEPPDQRDAGAQE